MRKSILVILFLLGFIINNGIAVESNVDRSDHTEAQFISESNAAVPGSSFWLALRMKMDPEWHTYWRNPGDSGLPTEITWELPEGFRAGEIQWPYPEYIETPPLVTYGYHDEIYLLVEMQVADNVETGRDAKISARVDWLECAEVCIPGGVDLAFTIPVKEQAIPDEKYLETFAEARAAIPLTKSEWQFTAQVENEKMSVFLRMNLM